MDERLSEMADRALRGISAIEQPTADQVVEFWPALAGLLRELGMFGRDMERTDALHSGDPQRQQAEREGAALRLYGRLVDPPHADNVRPLPVAGIGRFLMTDARRS